MKHIRILLSFVAIVAITSLIAVITGCEKDGDTGSDLDAYFDSHPNVSDPREFTGGQTGELTVSPESGTATTIGQQILFSVSGGTSPFTWDIANTAAGTITPQENGRQAIYTVVTLSENNVIVSDNSGKSGIANIDKTVASLSISPATVTLDPGGISWPTKATFTVSGGTAPYSWSWVYHSVGTLGATSGSSVEYTATSNTNVVNTITVVDANGDAVTATATHNR